MNPTRGMQTRLQQQQQQEARERTHEPICVKETRICWIEFGASLTCFVLGIIFVFAGVSADSSAVGSSGGSQAAKPAGILALTYLGVILLIIGAALLFLFGIHFHKVKTRLDAEKAERFAQLGIQPSSRYQQLPTQPATFGGPPRPPPLPLPPREQQQQQQQHQQQVPPQQRPQQQQMSSSRLQPMPSYREGAFYNLGFLGDETEARPPVQPAVATISTGRAPSQQQPPGSLLGRNAPLQSPTGGTVGQIFSKPNSFVGTAVESNKRGPSAHYGAPLPDEPMRQGPIGQYTAPPPADQNRHRLSTQHNPPSPRDHTRGGPSAHNVAQPPAEHTRRGLSIEYNASPADQTRHGPSIQYGTQQRDDYPKRSPYIQQNAPIPANYTKQGPPSSSEEASQRAVHAKRAGFAAPEAEKFSRGFMDAPPAGAVGRVQASRSYHSGFSGGANGQQMSASASGQNFQAKAASSESGRQGFKSERPYGESPYLPSWQRPPVETLPPQRSPPPGYALDPLSLMRQPLREGHQFEHQGHQQPSHQQQQRQRLHQQPAVSQPRKHQASGYRSSQI